MPVADKCLKAVWRAGANAAEATTPRDFTTLKLKYILNVMKLICSPIAEKVIKHEVLAIEWINRFRS